MLSVEDGSPADRANALPGDVVLALDGATIGGVDDLHRYLIGDRIGLQATLTVLRGLERYELAIALAERRV